VYFWRCFDQKSATMETLSAEYLFRAEAWLLITTLIYFIMNVRASLKLL